MSTTSMYEYVRHILDTIFSIIFALSVSLLKYETFCILERFMNTFPYSSFAVILTENRTVLLPIGTRLHGRSHPYHAPGRVGGEIYRTYTVTM
jgi:hypothetical protein